MKRHHFDRSLPQILLAEDNPRDAELTLNALRANATANEVIHVQDGSQALDYLCRRGRYSERAVGHPAFLLLDLKLPKMNGLEVLGKMKNDVALREVPVVIMTSSAEERDLRAAYQLGVNAYLVKPMKLSEFANVIQQTLIFWVRLNQRPRACAT